ncbi:MAG TPA: glycoside hydrolase N-terminal domain-containing protein, partial [Chitinophagaceae bacterium]|nr:glycoside hydrolase N-terminal domain-containing protein [Chitinophagaceae bacterium]
AQQWTDALPIGNGRLGAMIFGGVSTDHIQFNEETFWTGDPRNYNRKDAYRYLPRIRKLLSEGRQGEAEALAGKHFMGKKSHEDDYDSLFQRWLDKVRQPAALLPAQPTYDDRHWPEMKVPVPNGFEREVGSLEGENGAFWFRKAFTLPAGWQDKDLALALGNIRDMDFTYVNGHPVGSSVGKGKARMYQVSAAWLHPGKNVIAIQDINPDNKGGLSGFMHTHQRMSLYPAGSQPGKGTGEDTGKPIDLTGYWKYHIQDDGPPAFPHYQASYQPFGDLYLRFPDSGQVTDYKRSLNLANALCTTVYQSGGVRYKREYFASEPAQAIVIHLSASRKKAIGFQATLGSKHHLAVIKKIDDHTLAMDIGLNSGVLKGEARLMIRTRGGSILVDSGRITVRNADAAVLYLVAGTSFKNYKDVSSDPATHCIRPLEALSGKTYAAVRTAHIRAYQHYFNSFSINLGQRPAAALPTDQRIRKFDAATDPSLIALYVQYARYLLMASSWPGTLPPNLQGIWNNAMRPPWGSKYTTNINLEMNYWPAEVLHLSAFHEPLFAMLINLARRGRETAKDYYGCPGWVLHHNTDIWLGTAPIDNPDHGIWPTGGAWLCHQLWQHFLYTRDTVFLRDTAYPVMRSAARFFNCFLIRDPHTGRLISSPSNSPEHGGLVAGPTMDHQIIRDLFKNCMAAAGILDTDQAFADTLKEKYSRIAPNRIGRYGQLQEWLQDTDDTSDHYRHVSHLWGVFPGTDITWKTPALMKAARQSLLYRGDEGTGWSLAWKMNLWDRFEDGDHAFRLLKMALSPAEAPGRKIRGGSYHNLFDAHPPFQIDGNFGAAAAVAHMLLQSQGGIIRLLPALPRELPSGQVKGLCARGAFVLSFRWKHQKLTHLEVTSKKGMPCSLRYGDKHVRFDTKAGETYLLDGNLKLQ